MVRAAGSLTLAASDAELSLLKEAAERPDAERRGFELLDAAAVLAVNPALRGEFAGGLHCRLDAIVEPRQVLPALRGYLAARGEGQSGYEWHPGREVTEIAPNAVRDHTGTWHQCDPAFDLPGRAQLPPQEGPAAQARAQLLLVQRADGGLTIRHCVPCSHISLPCHSPRRRGPRLPILARQVGMMASQDKQEVASSGRADIG